ncbi:cytochrome c oxidase subunit II [Desertimonas flava]|uniref:cytochrome c oxidase subunit II n=1 Tax=Desertimonas flava TaxID=2064846 RepID=UPI000E3522CB|nr:cytochrome c oxidase subunit II [Desertimonas flava]
MSLWSQRPARPAESKARLSTGRRALPFAALGLVILLASCAKDAPQDTWQPEGDNAQKIHNLQWPVFAIAGLVLVIVALAVMWCVFRYRDRGQAIPEQTHGKPALEIGLTILPALILIGVAVPTVGTLMALNKTDDTACVVNVTGQQWWWEIDYPAGDCGGVAIDQAIVTSGQLVIPEDTNVLLRGTSRDVIHSFWVPKINGKRDMVPGRIHTLRLHADHPGIYAGQCAEFCGLSHANMRMEIVSLSQADFATWVANQLEPVGEIEGGELAEEGEALFISNCSRCHQVNGQVGADGQPVIAAPEDNVYSGAAPNLTHLMSRNTFAGATWDLLTPECREAVWEAEPEDFGAAYLEGVTAECLNEVDLREWLRNAPEKKPMFTEQDELAETNGLPRGMPNLNLSEEQIDALIAYLLELN